MGWSVYQDHGPAGCGTQTFVQWEVADPHIVMNSKHSGNDVIIPT